MKLHQRHSGRSPLIDPASTSLLLIAPDQNDLSLVKPQARSDVRQNLKALVAAAAIAEVRVFVASPIADQGQHALAKELSASSVHREFYSTERRLPWINADLVGALVEGNRPILVLAGFWLEFQIITTALHALAESYDVYVVVDAAPAQKSSAVTPSHHRLIQAGATPVVTAQVIHEWSVEAP